MKIDLFCHVIDNYGDVGVCWRLARQLVTEHGCKARLIVDDLGAFQVIAPEIDPGVARQFLLGVEVVAWSAADALTPHEVVIEAFACNPPPPYVEAMATRQPKPVWINLEYLSAEAWVDEIHGMPSQHQRLSLTKYFFCPGFTAASGGLIRERTVPLIIGAGDGAVPSPSGGGLGWGQAASEAGHDERHAKYPHPSPPPLGEGANQRPLQVFAFAYPHAPLQALTQAFAATGVPTTVALAAPISQSSPDWQTAATVPQTEFDALLAKFDFLIVRGEDSFVRAQWAAKPFLWHIYPTDDGAHLIKLDAWLDLYCVGLDANARAVYRAASHAFNTATGEGARSASYELLAQNISALTAHAARWRDTLLQQSDLATRLLELVGKHKANNLG